MQVKEAEERNNTSRRTIRIKPKGNRNIKWMEARRGQ